MNTIMACDEASEESDFLSALNASLAHFVHKNLKAEQVECIRRIVGHGKDVLAVLPTGSGKSAIYQCCLIWAVQPTPYQKPPLLW